MIKDVFCFALLILILPVCLADELSYDENGNLVSGDGNFRVYNSLNQLVAVYNGSSTNGTLLEEFEYHPTEERVLVKKDHVNNETTYYFSKSFVRIVNSSGTFNQTFVYHDGQLVAQDIDGERLYIHTDHLGSATVVTDENGRVVENTTYSPYGEILTGGSSELDYEGKEFDSVLGSYDFHFRQYNPEWSVFSQPDTLIQNVYDPLSLNRYIFEKGNPINQLDPSGHNYISLLAEDGAYGAGHSGGIVYNNDWAVYYSQDADTSDIADTEIMLNLILTGGPGNGKYIEAESLYVLIGENIDELSRYSHSFEYETSYEDDLLMREKMIEFDNDKSYSLLRDNCCQRQSSIMEAGNLNPNSNFIPKVHYIGSKTKIYVGQKYKSMKYSLWSKTKEGKEIIENNIKNVMEHLKSKGWTGGESEE